MTPRGNCGSAVELPRQGQAGGGLRIEHPAAGLRSGKRSSRLTADRKWVTANDRQQHAGQHERAFGAAQQHVQRQRNGGAGAKLCGDCRIGERAEIGERRPLVGDDLDRACDHQPAGGAEKAADHRIGHEADRAAGMGEAEHAEQEPGERRRQRMAISVGTSRSVLPAATRRWMTVATKCGDDDGDGAVRPGDRERQRTAQRHDRSADRRRQERDGDAVGQVRCCSGPVKISAA